MNKELERMTGYLKRKWWLRSITALIPIVMLLGLFLPAPVLADGGIAISGNFYRQDFRLFPGESLISPDIYVTAFNNSDTDMRIEMSTQVPPGVNLILSSVDFILPPGGQQRIEIGIELSPDAIPGKYEVGITADSYPETAEEGYILAGAAQQEADLTIFGEAGSVSIITLTNEGEPFTGIVRLYEQIESESNLCGFSNTGTLDMRLAPGDYVVECYLEDILVAEDSFSLAADEEKSVTLIARTAFVVGFSAVPNYFVESKELAFANLEYTIKNIYQPLDDIEVVLKVNREGTLVDEISVFSLSTLSTGNTAASYNNYIPPEGWESGDYGFIMELYVQGELYNQSEEVLLSTKIAQAEPPGGIVTEPEDADIATNWPMVGGIMGGVVVIVIVAVLRRKRRRN